MSTKFPQSQTALRFCPPDSTGIELGCAAHFRLAPHAKNVAPGDDEEFYDSEQKRMFGQPNTPIDHIGEATDLPFPDDSLDFVASSHVLEHCPNLLGALEEGYRVLKPGGIYYVVYPHRDALPADRDLPLTTLEHLIEDYARHETVDTHTTGGVPGGRRGHYHRLTLGLFLEAVNWLNAVCIVGQKHRLFEVVHTAEKDDVVGNGFVVVLRKVIPQ